MPMLIALLLLVVQSLAPQSAAALTAASSSAHATVVVAGAAAATADGRSDQGAERSVRGHEPRHAEVWLRAPHAFAHVAPSRVSGTPPTLPPVEASTARLSVEAAFAASVRVRTLDDSHEVSGRGALLPYYPTAPPLQG
jgi:hypothetical protein